jgi:hypothetical protein
MKVLKRKSIWLVLSLFVLSMQVNAQDKAFDSSALSAEGKTAYEELLKVDTFAIGGVGYSGGTSIGEKSLDILIGEDLAVSALKNLVGAATPEGSLYAVLGLKALKCECLDAEVKEFNGRTFSERKKLGRMAVGSEEIRTMSGCLGGAEKTADVLKAILSGDFDYWVHSRWVNRWSKEKG